jgi:hypothetical protein
MRAPAPSPARPLPPRATRCCSAAHVRGRRGCCRGSAARRAPRARTPGRARRPSAAGPTAALPASRGPAWPAMRASRSPCCAPQTATRAPWLRARSCIHQERRPRTAALVSGRDGKQRADAHLRERKQVLEDTKRVRAGERNAQERRKRPKVPHGGSERKRCCLEGTKSR